MYSYMSFQQVCGVWTCHFEYYLGFPLAHSSLLNEERIKEARARWSPPLCSAFQQNLPNFLFGKMQQSLFCNLQTMKELLLPLFFFLIFISAQLLSFYRIQILSTAFSATCEHHGWDCWILQRAGCPFLPKTKYAGPGIVRIHRRGSLCIGRLVIPELHHP